MKPRSDSKLKNLPEEQQAQLADWLLSGVPYHAAKAMVQKEFGVSTGIAALHDFYETVCGPELIARRHRAVTTADQVAEEAAHSPGRFDAATIDALKQKAFELAINPGADPSAVKSLFALVLKARSQDLDERNLNLAREKFEEQKARNAQAAEALKQVVAKGGIAQETIAQIEEALKLL
jgi:hypothetical protein